jgi:hypothetical protein
MAKKKSAARHRGLVLGHLERVSSAVFEKYRNVITELVGGKNGIYALYRNNQLYYVGLARDLRQRVSQHLRDRHEGKWNFFSLYLVRTDRYLGDLESLAIRVAYPRGNVQRRRLKGARDLRAPFKRKMTQQAMDEIADLMDRGEKAAPARRRKRTAASRTRSTAAKRAWASRTPPLSGLLRNKALRATYKGETYHAWVLPSGRIKLKHDGKIYNSPSGAGTGVTGKPTDGWLFWRYKNAKGQWAPIKTLRTRE